jgi:Domain of unknown function (DUF4326)
MTMLIEVGNIKELNPRLGFCQKRIDRTSVLGNPFFLREENERAAVIQAYRKYLWQCLQTNSNRPVDIHQIARQLDVTVATNYKLRTSTVVVNEIEALANSQENILLLCWCAPKACHGDVIKNCVLWIRQSKNLVTN